MCSSSLVKAADSIQEIASIRFRNSIDDLAGFRGKQLQRKRIESGKEKSRLATTFFGIADSFCRTRGSLMTA